MYKKVYAFILFVDLMKMFLSDIKYSDIMPYNDLVNMGQGQMSFDKDKFNNLKFWLLGKLTTFFTHKNNENFTSKVNSKGNFFNDFFLKFQIDKINSNPNMTLANFHFFFFFFYF